jgi:hypothetical protein
MAIDCPPTYTGLERYGDATVHLLRALQLYEQPGDITGMAHAHRSLTSALDGQGDYRQGLHRAEQALQLLRRKGTAQVRPVP